MKNKKIVVLIALVAVLAACVVAFFLFNGSPFSGKAPEETVALDSLKEILASQRSQLLESGKTVQLNLPTDRELTVATSNEKVATVDENGLVTAVGKGLALITVSDGNESAVCGVLVDAKGSLIDATKQTRKELFTDLELYSTAQIAGMTVDVENQTVYFAQGPLSISSFAPLNSDVLVSKVQLKDKSWDLAGWMRFSGCGKGSISVDKDGQTTRLWLESNGDYIGYGNSISLVDWSENSYCEDSYGQVFNPQGVSGSMTVTADSESNMVLVYDRSAKCYRIYDRAQMLAGEEAPEYVHSFSCKANQTPAAGVDDSKGRYNASVHGYALYDGYLYQFSGSSSIYLSVFDLEGNLQYCHRLVDLPDTDYYMPASISVADGKIYLAIATGNSDYNLANLLVFE